MAKLEFETRQPGSRVHMTNEAPSAVVDGTGNQCEHSVLAETVPVEDTAQGSKSALNRFHRKLICKRRSVVQFAFSPQRGNGLCGLFSYVCELTGWARLKVGSWWGNGVKLSGLGTVKEVGQPHYSAPPPPRPHLTKRSPRLSSSSASCPCLQHTRFLPHHRKTADQLPCPLERSALFLRQRARQ